MSSPSSDIIYSKVNINSLKLKKKLLKLKDLVVTLTFLKMATTRLFYDRDYTVGFYFNKGSNPSVFMSKLKSLLPGEWNDNICKFKSKDIMDVLHAKIEGFIKKIKEDTLINTECFSNFRLSFVNTKSITLYSDLIEKTPDIDTVSELVKERIKSIVSEIPKTLRKDFKLDDSLETCTYLNDKKKILISINENTHLALCIGMLQRINVLSEIVKYSNDQKQIFLSKKNHDHIELFSLNINNDVYRFNEYLNICKRCVTCHVFESTFNCFKRLCKTCGGMLEREHECIKSKTCKLCELYHHKTLEHQPLSKNCYHLKNMENIVFVNTRQLRLKDFIDTISNCESYNFEETSYPSSLSEDMEDSVKEFFKESYDTIIKHNSTSNSMNIVEDFVLNTTDFPDLAKPSSNPFISNDVPEEEKKKSDLELIINNLEFTTYNLLKNLSISSNKKDDLKSIVEIHFKQLQFQVEELLPSNKEEASNGFTIVTKKKKKNKGN